MVGATTVTSPMPIVSRALAPYLVILKEPAVTNRIERSPYNRSIVPWMRVYERCDLFWYVGYMKLAVRNAST